ncbi:DoxX family protein [Oscillatoria sp. FACHB-1407]|uniref:DoxX family protein n=1 Tax=Oscillatoria sp. FACHB-1407 TaxID=2692847 RepID=UPI00168494AB|nr:DoxX family protein [Oscillatoria sp. FACHB-1407]MBD2461916.1 DoxX family protein [Oscillatoria sp. FACHB-1407]
MANHIPNSESTTESSTTATVDRGLYATRNHIPLIARILLSALFLVSGINKILNPAATQDYMASAGMPLTGLFLVAAIALELGGGLSVLLGYRARWGAIALIGFTAIATLIFHTNLSDQLQQIMFLKNLAIIGGLLMIVQYGSGTIALLPDRNR